ncbi:hypothetical protein BGZ61DRAFT_472757 [Ilyonectria robusta]|uniref:uncharacterized protein n=1 Tax=Ilyonectria robusta TaxID=1079257 RepID=UPI001E8DE356|nr:uncharacterized protein BGZ61DRAFT_472757 [Ilyonectria robusta]KAH8736431.1 hypothetical protein BGZ61DRAFT_472757 [Ilyonectria robusta]
MVGIGFGLNLDYRRVRIHPNPNKEMEEDLIVTWLANVDYKEDSYRIRKEMKDLQQELVVLQNCVAVLECKTNDAYHEAFSYCTTYIDKVDLATYWEIAQDFVKIYQSYLETGDKHRLFNECHERPDLNWKHATWIRMFVLLTFGPGLEEVYSPCFVEGRFLATHITSQGMKEFPQVSSKIRLSARYLLKSVFRISAVEAWVDKAVWLKARDKVLKCQKNRIRDDYLEKISYLDMSDEGLEQLIVDDDTLFLEDFFVNI